MGQKGKEEYRMRNERKERGYTQPQEEMGRETWLHKYLWLAGSGPDLCRVSNCCSLVQRLAVSLPATTRSRSNSCIKKQQN